VFVRDSRLLLRLLRKVWVGLSFVSCHSLLWDIQAVVRTNCSCFMSKFMLSLIRKFKLKQIIYF